MEKPALNVGDQVEWTDHVELCEGGICKGVVTQIWPEEPKYPITVEWWQLCTLHHKIDYTGTGPYEVSSLTKI